MSGNIIGSLEIQMLADLARLKTDMDAAKGMVGGAMAQINSAVEATKSVMATLGVATTVGAFAALIEKTIEASAELYRMSERTGVTVESLSALRSVAKLSGTSMDQVATGMQKLSKNMVEAQGGTGKAADAFTALGVRVTDSNGKLKTADQVTLEVAQSMIAFKDGAGLTAAMMAIFGKSGADLIPMLKELADKGSLNGKVTTEQATQAYEFEKAQVKLRASIDAVTRGIAMDLIPIIVKLANFFKPALEITAGYVAVMYGLPAVMAAGCVAIDALAATMIEGGVAAATFSSALSASVSQTTAAITSFGLLKSAGMLALAAFAGWEIGKWLRENFVEAQLAGIFFVDGLLVGWEKVKYGAQAMWLAFEAAMSTVFGAVGTGMAATTDLISRGFAAMGMDTAAAATARFSQSIRDTSKSSFDFNAELKKLGTQTDQNIAGIQAITGDMVNEAEASFKTAGAHKVATKELVLASDASTNAASNYRQLLEAALKLADASVLKASEQAAEVESGIKLSEADKNYIKVMSDVRDGKLKYVDLVRNGTVEKLQSAMASEAQSKATAEEKKWMDEAAKANEAYREGLVKKTDSMQADNAKLAEANAIIGLNAQQLLAREVAQLTDTAAGLDRLAVEKGLVDWTGQQSAELRKQAGILRDRAGLLQDGVALKEAQAAQDAWGKTTEEIGRGLTDSLFRAFESGKGFFTTFWDGIKNLFKTTAMKLLIQPVQGAIGAVLGTGNAAAAGPGGGGGLSGLSNLYSSASNAWDAASPWLSDFGGSTEKAVTTLANQFGGKDLQGWLAQNSGVVADYASIAGDALGYLGALKKASDGQWGAAAGAAIGTYFAGPIGAAIGQMLGGVVDKFAAGGAGTPHQGSVVGVDATGKGSTLFGDASTITDHYQKSTDDALRLLGGTSVGALNAISAAFGGQGGFASILKFASDGHDASIGDFGLSRNGKSLVNWGDDTGNFHKYVSDAKEAFKAYTTDVASATVRALDTIGLPKWARDQFAQLGNSATLDDFTKLTASILQMQGALRSLQSLVSPLGGVFARVAGLSGDALKQLTDFAGGIDAFAGKVGGYVKNYFSAQEQASLQASAVNKQLADAGVNAGGLTDRASFRALVDSIDVGKEAGRQQLAALLNVQETFAQLGDFLAKNGGTLASLAALAPVTGALGSLTTADSGTQTVAGLVTVNDAVLTTGNNTVTAIDRLNSRIGDLEAALTDALDRNARTVRDAVIEANG